MLDAPNEQENGIYIVNTNKTYMPEVYKQMVENKKASAYYTRKRLIKKIKKDDIVCLYHVGVGVIGIGTATTEYQKKEYAQNPDAEYFVPVNFDFIVDITQPGWQNRAVKASEINGKFNTGHRFRQTVFSISKEISDFVREKLKEKTIVNK